MGSPSVFQTAPPHPASNARITWSPQLAGGPDASQNGFGQRMPFAKLVVRSAMLHLLLFERLRHRHACAFALGHGVYYFASAVHAIAACVVARVRRAAAFGIDGHRAVANFDATAAREEVEKTGLADGGNHHVALD